MKKVKSEKAKQVKGSIKGLSYFVSAFLLAGSFALVIIAAGDVSGQRPDRVVFSLSGLPKTISAGTDFDVKLVAKIEDGWHVYGLTKIAGGPIPTRITLAEKQPFTLSGEIGTPEPIVDRDSAFGVDLEYYEGDAEFILPIEARPGTPVGNHLLTVSVRFQVCSQEMCLPPKVKDVSAPIRIKTPIPSRKQPRRHS